MSGNWRPVSVSSKFLRFAALVPLLTATLLPGLPLLPSDDARTGARASVRHGTRADLLAAAAKLQAHARLGGPDAARDQLALGEIYVKLSWFPRASDLFHLVTNTASDIDLQCIALSDLADVESTLGHKTDSLEDSERAVRLAEKGASPRVRARAWESQALALLYDSQPLEALERLQSAKLQLTAEEPEELGAYFLYSGFAHLTVNKTPQALDDTLDALAIWRKAGDVSGMARANAALGLLWATLGEPAKARTALNAAGSAFRAIGDVEHEAVYLNSLGTLSAADGDHRRSREYFHGARNKFARLGDLVGEIGAMKSEAEELKALGKPDAAENIYRLVFKLIEKDESGLYRGGALLQLGDMYASSGRFQEAEDFYKQALRLREKQKQEVTRSEVLFHLADFYKKRERHEDALQLLRQALDSAAERPDKAAQAHFELAGIDRNLARIDSARAEIEDAIRTIEAQREKHDDSETRAFYFSSVHSYYQLYIDILMDLYKERGGDYAVRAFEASEKSKVRSLLDVIDCHHSPAAPPDADAHRAGMEAPCDAHALKLSEIQAALRGDNAVLLEYAQSGDGKHGYLWAVDENQILVKELPDFNRLNSLTRKVLDDVTARIRRGSETTLTTSARVIRARRSFKGDAATLATSLWGSVADLIAGRRMIIVPDGELPDLPYAVLISGLPPKLAPSSVVSLPSASLLGYIRKEAEPRRPHPALAAIFSNPVYSRSHRRPGAAGARRSPPPPAMAKVFDDLGIPPDSIPELRNNEARYIKQVFPGEEILMATRFRANLNVLLHTDLTRYRYLHFSVHGLLDTRYPEFSGLLLSLFNEKGEWQDGYLSIPEIHRLSLAADVVVLSACDSALGKDMKSEGMIALPRAFLSAGARSVLSTLWKVDEESTAWLMKRFYTHLREGKAPDVALQLAQTEVRGVPEWHDPYFWAGFILQGDYRLPAR